MRVAADPELLPWVENSILMYQRRLGLTIEIHDDGFPISVVDEVLYKGAQQDGLAHYDRYCAFERCNAPDRGVYIIIARGLLTDKVWAMQATIDHELGHVISGWGHEQGVPMHIPETGHMMSPGCRNRVCWPISTRDSDMLCAGAPCDEEKL